MVCGANMTFSVNSHSRCIGMRGCLFACGAHRSSARMGARVGKAPAHRTLAKISKIAWGAMGWPRCCHRFPGCGCGCGCGCCCCCWCCCCCCCCFCSLTSNNRHNSSRGPWSKLARPAQTTKLKEKEKTQRGASK